MTNPSVQKLCSIILFIPFYWGKKITPISRGYSPEYHIHIVHDTLWETNVVKCFDAMSSKPPLAD